MAVITYLVSDIGKDLVSLLSALRRTSHYNQLSIKDRLVAFHRFWDRTLNNIARQQTQIAVVQMLSKDQYTNYNLIHVAFQQSGGTVSSGKQKQCEKLFGNFNRALLFKSQIDLLFETFAPSQQYWDKDIKDLHAVYVKLKHWHELSLEAILTGLNWRLVSDSGELLMKMETIGLLMNSVIRSLVCVCVRGAC